MLTSEDNGGNEHSKGEEGDPKKGYIRRMQMESWYLEMITSGVAIFLLFKLPGLIDTVSRSITITFSGGLKTLFTGFPIILKMTSYVWILSLIIHLVLRAFWIGVIGINSVFPKGIRTESLPYSPHIKKKLNKLLPDMDRWIQQLDDACSVIYGLAFFTGLVILGSTFYVILAVLLGILFHWILTALLGGLALLFMLDFFSLGVLKRVKAISGPYYLLYRFVGACTLAFLYRPFYYLLLTNLKKRYVAFFLLGYFALIYGLFNHTYIAQPVFPVDREYGGFILNREEEAGIMHDLSAYRNQREKDQRVIRPVINKDVYNEGDAYLKLFYPLLGKDIDQIRHYCMERGVELPIEKGLHQKFMVWNDEIGGLVPEGRYLPASQYKEVLNVLNEMVMVTVDDSLHQDPGFTFCEYPLHGEKGMIAYLPIDHLSPGRHELKVRSKAIGRVVIDDSSEEKKFIPDMKRRIPFWVE